MKKVFALTAALFVAVTIETYAVGLGIQFGANMLNGFNTPGVSVLISPSKETHFAGTWYVENNGMTIGVSADYWLLPLDLTQLGTGMLKFYLGGGLYGQIEIWEDHFGIAAGLRVPVGLDWEIGPIDVFFQAVPLIGIGFLPSPSFEGFHIDFNLGGRFWFGG